MSEGDVSPPGEPVGPITGQHEVTRLRGQLEGPRLAHLLKLMASWNLLSDFCFSDLLLFVPSDPVSGTFRVLGQVRPSTSQTLYRRDLIGQVVDEAGRPVVARSFRLGEIIEGEIVLEPVRERVRILCIPVRFKGEILGVLTRESTPTIGRQQGELERTYLEIFNRFARMIVAGEFPYPSADSESDEAPRVGDGVIVLDAGQRVSYASPNAVSALHRLGMHVNIEGMRLGEVGLDDEVVRNVYDHALPASVEMEPRSDTNVLLHCMPLLDRGEVTGAVLLVRDISELRRRDRLLLSKDATIREIHHRVKNNLQTVSSLLRLQGRRMAAPEAKAAVEESVRRIASIAVVHETLSREAGEDVPFVEILRPLLRMVEDGLLSPEREIHFALHGDAGTLPADIATPLAMVLAELLQNAVDHAFPDERPGEVVVELAREVDELVIRVVDDGVGVPDGFSIDTAEGLGLSIVRALVTSDLHGTITVRRPASGRDGTEVELRLPATTAGVVA
jgi:two-component sensor histidine kinase